MSWRLARWPLAAAVAAVVVLGGCSSPVFSPASSPATWEPTASVDDGILLTSLGYRHAPPGFAIPKGLTPLHGYDMPGLVDVIFAGADGPTVHDYLVSHLPQMGYTITASSADSIVWENPSWQGAFTMTSVSAGLTLRASS